MIKKLIFFIIFFGGIGFLFYRFLLVPMQEDKVRLQKQQEKITKEGMSVNEIIKELQGDRKGPTPTSIEYDNCIKNVKTAIEPFCAEGKKDPCLLELEELQEIKKLLIQCDRYT